MFVKNPFRDSKISNLCTVLLGYVYVSIYDGSIKMSFRCKKLITIFFYFQIFDQSRDQISESGFRPIMSTHCGGTKPKDSKSALF